MMEHNNITTVRPERDELRVVLTDYTAPYIKICFRITFSAVIFALEALKEPCRVILYSDSQYVCNALKLGWAKKWKSQGWMRNKKDPALNPELWDKLLSLCEVHEVEVNWVKGHAGHPENERCDRLAVAAAQQYS